MKKIVAALFVLSLVGCSTLPSSSSKGDRTPASRIVDQSIASPKQGTREIIIKREEAFYAAGIDARFFLNGKRVANIGNGEVFRMYLPDGGYRIGVQIGGYDSGGPVRELSMPVGPNEHLRFRINFEGDGFTLRPTSF